MEELLSLKRDGHARYGDIVIMTGAVVDICADSKCNWFALSEGTKDNMDENIRFHLQISSDCAKNVSQTLLQLLMNSLNPKQI